MSFFTGGGGTTAPRDPTKRIGDQSRTGNIGGYDAGGSTGAGRKNVNNAPVVGQAMTREEYKASQMPAPPPSTAAAASLAQGGAKSAAERQRKRAAAGEQLVAGAGKAGPLANLTPKTLIGA
jgi:hypothetical protein